jgi:hypothetical protein
MTFQEFLNLHGDLLYAPLCDTNVPLCETELTAWCNTQKCVDELQAEQKNQTELEQIKPKNFALSKLYLLDESFYNSFPEFKSWFSELPFIKNSGKGYDLAMLRQSPDRHKLTREMGLPTHSPIHIDAPGCIGLRIYINNQNNNMYIYELKNNFEWKRAVGIHGDSYYFHKLDHKGFPVSVNGVPVPPEDKCYPGKRALAPKNCIFLLNENNCAHGVAEENPDGNITPDKEKFTILIISNDNTDQIYNWEQLDKYLQKSKDLHPEKFIFSENKEKKMTETHLQMKKFFEEYLDENDKFETKGVKAAAARARKALGELGKLAKTRRAEIQDIKNAM